MSDAVEIPYFYHYYEKSKGPFLNLFELSLEEAQDLFPTFSPLVNDNREYRRQIYTFEEIVKLIQKYQFSDEKVRKI